MVATTKPLQAATYLRLSKVGEAPIERQRQDCSALIASRGWQHAGEYVDNLSAFRDDVFRPSYNDLLDRIATGALDVVVVYHRDRLWRQVTEQAAFIRTSQKSGLNLIASVSEGDIDPNSPTDKFVATILAAHSEMSSEDTRRRVRRAELAAAKEGKAHGGGYRAFGYERDGTTIREHEAELVRAAVKKLLAGGSLTSVVNQWNAGGVLTTAGGPWRRPALRNMLIRPRIAGRRQHHNDDMGHAVWPALVEDADWRRLRAILTGRTANNPEPVALLSGIALCGRCGAPLGSEPPRLRPDGRRIVERLYACRPRSDGGCRSLSIRAAQLDRLVEERMFGAIRDGSLATALRRRERVLTATDTMGALAELDGDRQQLDDLRHDYYVRKTMSRSTFLEMEGALMDRVAANERLLGEPGERVDLRPLMGGVTRFKKAWLAKADDQVWRRQMIRAVFHRIEVLPSPTRGGRKFDETRVLTTLI